MGERSYGILHPMAKLTRPMNAEELIINLKQADLKKYNFVDIYNLLRKVQVDLRTGCWIGYGKRPGYRTISINGIGIRAHRYSYLLFNGPILKNHFICHKCDVPECINPNHLFQGTADDNIKDAMKKGRLKGLRMGPRGFVPNKPFNSNNPKQKKSEQIEIKENINNAIDDLFKEIREKQKCL
jgi:hypothetical protein